MSAIKLTCQTHEAVCYWIKTPFKMRLIREQGGDIWIVGRDCAAAMGSASPASKIKQLVSDKEKKRCMVTAAEGGSYLWLITPAGAKEMCERSYTGHQKGGARWITEVLCPAIRDGSYEKLSVYHESCMCVPVAGCTAGYKSMNTAKQAVYLERRMQSSMLYLNKDSYSSEEYVAKLKEIWGEDKKNYQKELEFYLE